MMINAADIVEGLRAGHPDASDAELLDIAQTTAMEYSGNEIEADRLYDAVCRLVRSQREAK